MKFLYFLLLGIVAYTFFSCRSDVVYEKSYEVNESGWSNKNHLLFDVDFVDTVQSYDFYLTFRHTIDYPYNNIFFFLTTFFPDSSVSQMDTLECFLSNYEGDWMGNGNGRLRDVRFRFAKNILLPMSGPYRFDLQHASRDTMMKEVRNVGIRITRRDF